MLETRAEVGLIAPRSRPRFPGPLRGVTAHWNGPAMNMAGKPHTECRARWQGIQRFHMGKWYTPNPNPNGRHWHDVAYSAAVCHHAVAMEGRGVGVRTAANGTNDGNNGWYAIFFLLGGDEQPSQQMLSAAEWYARTHLKTTTWNRHTDHKATTCAGTVNAYISGGVIRTDGEAAPGAKPKKTPEPTPAVSPPQTASWTERIVDNLPTRRQRTNLSQSSTWDRRVQGLLVANGHAPDNTIDSRGRLDGKFGPGTDRAVKSFQRSQGLGVDGIVGRNTWTKLLGR